MMARQSAREVLLGALQPYGARISFLWKAHLLPNTGFIQNFNIFQVRSTWLFSIYSPSNIIVAGDLNVILEPKEKKGGVRGKDPLQDSVESLIQANDILDFKPKKGRFTWSNNILGATNISAHIDRFLVQSSLMEGKFIISTKILPKLILDHHPISLMFEKEEDLGPILFHFSPLWIERHDFWETVIESWSQYV